MKAKRRNISIRMAETVRSRSVLLSQKRQNHTASLLMKPSFLGRTYEHIASLFFGLFFNKWQETCKWVGWRPFRAPDIYQYSEDKFWLEIPLLGFGIWAISRRKRARNTFWTFPVRPGDVRSVGAIFTLWVGHQQWWVVLTAGAPNIMWWGGCCSSVFPPKRQD